MIHEVEIDLRPLPVSEDWHFDALCRGLSPEMFLADQEDDDLAAARSVCRRCPVPIECLREGLDQEDQVMVRGGLTFKERRRLFTKPTRPPPTTIEQLHHALMEAAAKSRPRSRPRTADPTTAPAPMPPSGLASTPAAS